MTAINKLTDKKLRELMKGIYPSVFMLHDGGGLGVRVSKNGTVSWVFSYRLAGRGAPVKRLTLGKYPDMSIKLARQRRDQCREWRAEGLDPQLEMKMAKLALLNPVTVRDTLEHWLTNYARHKRRDEEQLRAQLAKHVYPRVGDYPLHRCTTQLWVKCFDEINAYAPKTAARMFQHCKQALRFASVRQYAVSDALIHLTPLDVGALTEEGDRVLIARELADVWRFTYRNERYNYDYWMFKILIVFGCRTHEARVSRWDEWDLHRWTWTVPKEHSKNKEKIIRPVPVNLRPWITELHRLTGDTGILLGEVDSRCAVSLRGRRFWEKTFNHREKWTLHDIRRTFSTGLSDLGTPPHIVEQLLGHKLTGVMAVYNKSTYLPEKLKALNAWLDYLDNLITE
ncbi:site-specific integrase [Escherichia coli]|nr:site-specific integrase [Escherichia coli]EHL6434014.1 site-specific integrase [Escherichia coli]HAX2344363.1 site-specific integrase [Escherichia coli]HBN7233379.1 site-specific integrase [Escherichia coli]HBQ4882049.1 site-specific integrase [Escherichia coli]